MSSTLFLYDPFQELDRLFDGALNARVNGQTVQRRLKGDFRPKMDLHENTEANTVTATFELPGLTKENLDISVHDGQLTISGEHKISSEHEERAYAVRERRFGKFSRTIKLPRGVTDAQIKASLENGVLTVTLPKSTPETASKKIAIV
ncbi:HSP20-like chaperone [Amanita muscaria]